MTQEEFEAQEVPCLGYRRSQGWVVLGRKDDGVIGGAAVYFYTRPNKNAVWYREILATAPLPPAPAAAR